MTTPPAPTTPGDAAAAAAPTPGAIAAAQARAAQLVRRWRGRRHFTVLALDWAQGLDWLATWAAWRDDPQRCQHLVWVVVSPALFQGPTPPWPTPLDGQPPTAPAGWAALWAQLQALWPPATPDLHALLLEAGQVQLHLAPGTTSAWWTQLRLQADALQLPASPPPDWGELPAAKALARQTAPGAEVFSPAPWPAQQAGQLQAVGFGPKAAPDGLTGCWAHFQPPGREPARASVGAPTPPQPPHALVLGAGLAGAATALALARLGWRVQVVDRLPGPAQATSGNPGGLFHGTAHADDGLHARLLRAAALFAARDIAPRVAAGLPGQADGLLRLDALGLADAGLANHHVPAAAPWPKSWLQTLSSAQASARAGLPMQAGGTWFPSGGWASPADLVRAWLQHPGIEFLGGLDVHRLGAHMAEPPPATRNATRADPRSQTVPGAANGPVLWQLLGAQDQVVAQAPVLVLATAAGTLPLLASPCAPAACLWPQAGLAWPLGLQRGQVSWWCGVGDTALRHPVAGGGGGYALPLPGGVLFGATTQRGDADPQVRDSDHLHNLQRLQQLTGLVPPAGQALQGRVGWRVVSEDRLPVAGPVPSGQVPRFATQAGAWARAPGLFVCTALGGRGLTLAPLLGQLVAAQVAGLPAPLPQRLVEAVDPARWLVKQARHAGR